MHKKRSPPFGVHRLLDTLRSRHRGHRGIHGRGINVCSLSLLPPRAFLRSHTGEHSARACVFRLTVRPTIDRRTADRVGRFTSPHRAARTDRATFTADRPIWSSSTRFEATGALSHARRSQAWSARSGVTTDGRVHIYWVSLSNYVDTPSNAGIRRNESRDRRSKFSSKRRG